jgi:hypothetical protein
MAFQPIPFTFLSDDGVVYLLDEGHQDDKRIYFDCLALLHDILAAYGSTEGHSQFDFQFIKRQLIERRTRLSSQAVTVQDNVNSNLNAADVLYQELTAPMRNVTSAVIGSFVDIYLSQLLDMYRRLRLPTSRMQTKAMGATP